MKKLQGRYFTLIIIGIFFVLWNVLVFTIANLKEARHYFWFGYAFIFLAFLVAAGTTWLFKGGKNVTFSVLTPVYLFTIIYFIITFILNTIFMIICTGTNAKAIVIPNVVVILLYAAIMVVAYVGMSHIKNTNAVIDEKVAALKLSAIKVGQIAAIAEDGEVISALNGLREAIEYSDPMGIPVTAALEADINFKIAEIGSAVENGDEKEIILKKINFAFNKLKERNETLRAMK